MGDASLLQDFIIETKEHLENIENKILLLDDQPENKELVNELFRSVHTIKGSSEYLGLRNISELSHRLENLLDFIRHGKCSVSSGVTDVLISSKDRMEKILEDIESEQIDITEVSDIIEKINIVSGESSLSVDADEREDESVPRKESDISVSELSDESLPFQSDDEDSYDNYEEDMDTELFGIFLEQLKKEISILSGMVSQLYRFNNPQNVLKLFSDKIKQLKSSANYMGYENLCRLYDQWLMDVSVSEKQILENQPVDVEKLIDLTFKKYVADLAKLFPEFDVASVMKPTEDILLLNEEVLLEDIEKENDESSGVLLLDAEVETDLAYGAEGDHSGAQYIRKEEYDLDDDEELFSDLNDLDMEESSSAESSDKEKGKVLEAEFIEETEEHLLELEYALLDLTDTPDDKDLMNTIFRTIHTIKGSSEYLGFEHIALLTHKVESLLDHIRQGSLSMNKKIVELLIQSKDTIEELVRTIEYDSEKPVQYDPLLLSIEALLIQDETHKDESVVPSPRASVTIASFSLNKDAADFWELYEDEYDEELIGIFLEQMTHIMDQMHDEIKEISDAQTLMEKRDIFLVFIDKLKSSANYMGYGKLVEEYDSWEREINSAVPASSTENYQDQSGADFVDNLIRPYLERMSILFHPERDALEAFGNHSKSASISHEDMNEVTQFDDSDKVITLADEDVAISIDEMELYEKLENAFDHNANRFGMPDEDKIENSLESENIAEFDDAELLKQSENLESENVKDNLIEKSFIEKSLLSDFVDQTSYETVREDRKDAETETFVDWIDPAKVEDIDFTSESEIFSPVKPDGTDIETIGAHDDLSEEVEPSPFDPTYSLGLRIDSFEEGKIDTKDLQHEDLSHFIPAAVGDTKSLPSADTEETDLNDPVIQSKKSLSHQNIRVDASKIDLLMNQVGELVVNRSYFSQLNNDMRLIQQQLSQIRIDKKDLKTVKSFAFRLSEATVFLGRVINELQDGVMRVRMLPISQLFNRYPRLVRDLTKGTEKKVRLEIIGEETELDKMVIEKISDPLIHIIRNAVDHGIETMTERDKKGKDKTGVIRLEAYHESNNVVIEITDDGRGFNIEKIKNKILERKLASLDEVKRMSDREMLNFIMIPGFSTSETITHTSGRGVGMDVVKKNIEKLNGTVELNFEKGINTQIRIKIPLTLAIFPALLVYVGSDVFTIPLSSVEETLRSAVNEISVIEGIEVLNLRDEPVPILRLSKLFHMKSDSDTMDTVYIVIVNTGLKRLGLVVDRLIGQEEVVIKPLEDYLQENSGFSGATILGDGRISLILDVYELMNISMENQIRQHADLII